MCGICGYTGTKRPGVLRDMAERIRHRGPDAGGFFERHNIHLGSRRLRVLDLDGGDQPISNEDGSVHVIYNGEIYNFKELRLRLQEAGHTFRTDTDTEVIVHLYEDHGIECAKHLNGMFAFALYDERRRRLLLARDPVGIKPLVYSWDGSSLIFASEAKSFLAHPQFSAALNPDALHQLLNLRFVPSPLTLFKGVQQLPPGNLLILEGGSLVQKSFHSWDFSDRTSISEADAAEEFLETLSRVMKRQMVADVPVGIFLSGGIDSSSLVAAATQAGKGSQLRTVALGLGEPTDELQDAEIVAAHFGTKHSSSTVSPDFLSLYPRVVFHAEAPKVNAVQGYFVSRFARDQVTVALSGLGGDELFIGYDIYQHLWPGRFLMDGTFSGVLRKFSGAFDFAAGWFDRMAGLRGENFRRAIELLAASDDPLRYYCTLRNGWDLRSGASQRIYTPSWNRLVSSTTRDAFSPYFNRLDLSFIERVQWAEFQSKMVDDFLHNEDRMSMANSLEVRVPLLDLEMVKFAFSLPTRVKFRNRRRKVVMRRALAPLLPPSILRKKKLGFTFNSYQQYRQGLRKLCIRELTRDFIEEQGIFRYDFIKSILDTPPSPLLRWHYFMLWQLLGLKFWQEIFLENRHWREIEERILHGQ